MAEEKKIEQPSVDLQELLDSVLHDEPTEFVFGGKKHKLGWLRKGTMSKCSHIRAKEKNEWKRNVKICVCILLNTSGRFDSCIGSTGAGSTTSRMWTWPRF